MKYKKYLVFIMLLMIFNVNKIYAETCYYQVAGENSLAYDSSNNEFKINDADGSKVKWYQIAKKKEKILNFNKDFNDKKETGLVVSAIPGGTCPSQIVFRTTGSSDGIFGFTETAKAIEFAQASNDSNGMEATIINRSYITEAEYNNNLLANNGGDVTKKENQFELEDSGTDVDVTCNEIFGSKTDPESISYLVNKILSYPRYIIPAIIVLMGTLDFFKAVIAGKEDEMKKAQRTFIKRVIIGVCVFLVPLLINGIMWLADIVWSGGYTHCNL